MEYKVADTEQQIDFQRRVVEFAFNALEEFYIQDSTKEQVMIALEVLAKTKKFIESEHRLLAKGVYYNCSTSYVDAVATAIQWKMLGLNVEDMSSTPIATIRGSWITSFASAMIAIKAMDTVDEAFDEDTSCPGGYKINELVKISKKMGG